MRRYCPPVMELLLIRHGLPVAVDNRDTGIEANPVLSELGCRQAEALADWFVNPPTAQRILSLIHI